MAKSANWHLSDWLLFAPTLGFLGYATITSGQMLLRDLVTPDGLLSKIATGAMLIAPTIFISLTVALSLFGSKQKTTLSRWIAPIILIGLILRLTWIFAYPTEPVSDFLINHQIALQLSQDNFQLSYPRSISYPFFLGLLYRFFPDPISGRLLNAALGTVSIWLCYQIGCQINQIKSGLAAAALMAFMPNEIMMSSVLCTEIGGTTFFLTAFLALIRLWSKSTVKNAILAGFWFGMAILFRPNMIVFFSLILIQFFLLRSMNLRKRFISLGLYILAIFVPSLMIIGWHIVASGIWSIKPLSNPSAAATLISGTNIKSDGGYQANEASIYWSWPESQRTTLALQTAWDRIVGNPKSFIDLVGIKMNRIISDATYAFNWSSIGVNGKPLGIPLYRWQYAMPSMAQSFYILLLLMAGIYLPLGPRSQFGWRWIFFLFLLLAISPHIVLESQPRYQHVFYPILALAAGQGMAILSDTFRSKRFDGTVRSLEN